MKQDDVEVKVTLVEGKDYYLDNGLMVLTASYHLRRGYCCDNGCRHCPYEDRSLPAPGGEVYESED